MTEEDNSNGISLMISRAAHVVFKDMMSVGSGTHLILKIVECNLTISRPSFTVVLLYTWSPQQYIESLWNVQVNEDVIPMAR